jgi:hypothetical protein
MMVATCSESTEYDNNLKLQSDVDSLISPLTAVEDRTEKNSGPSFDPMTMMDAIFQTATGAQSISGPRAAPKRYRPEAE